jgi:hypothetical protein
MVSEEDKRFMEYWRQNRDKQRKVFRQFLLGIPVALLFTIPILVNFVSGWYKRAAMVANTQDFNPGVLLAALLLIVGFVAIFSRKLQWEKNEQRYRELEARSAEEEARNDD